MEEPSEGDVLLQLMRELPGFTLRKFGSGSWRASWIEYPTSMRYIAESRTSPVHALQRLKEQLVEAGVILG